MNPSITLLNSILFSTFLVLFQTMSSNGNDQPPICGPFDCGDNIKQISYPFRKKHQSHYCGHPGFELDCESDTNYPIFEQNSQKFKVLKIYPQTRVLKIVSLDLSNNVCPEKSTSSFDFDQTLFNYTSSNRITTLSYNCDDLAINQTIKGIVKFPCDKGNNNSRLAYFSYVQDMQFFSDFCNVSVAVPVMDEALRNGSSDSIDVDDVLRQGFEVQWKSMEEEKCMDCMKNNGSCGFDRTMSTFICICPDQKPHHQHGNWSCVEIPLTSNSGLNWILRAVIIGIGAGVLGVVLKVLLSTVKTSITLSNFKKIDKDIESSIVSCRNITAKRYRFSQVRKISGSFKDKLGQGGYGEVYKGKLKDGRLVAVKLLNSSKGDGQEFINEVLSISRTSHVNIVSLLGFCFEGGKRALLYEFMPNGSLEKFVYNESASRATPNLEWEKMIQIATGIARGLEYLHRGCNTKILHLDIKPHNILLDEDLCPKISDFGLAKLCPNKQSNVSLLHARGTIGYIAPEVFNRGFGGVSSKSDVYSYGMMILEMVGGRNNIKADVSKTSEIYFPDWIYKQLKCESGLRLWGDITREENEIARKMIIVGLWCIQISPSDRPSMSKVIEMLEGSLVTLPIPTGHTISSPTSLEILFADSVE